MWSDSVYAPGGCPDASSVQNSSRFRSGGGADRVRGSAAEPGPRAKPAEQKDALKTITEDVAKQQRELSQGARGQGGAGGGRGQANAEKMTALRKESLEKIQKMLTADQKKTWKDMTGDPFENQRGPG